MNSEARSPDGVDAIVEGDNRTEVEADDDEANEAREAEDALWTAVLGTA